MLIRLGIHARDERMSLVPVASGHSISYILLAIDCKSQASDQTHADHSRVIANQFRPNDRNGKRRTRITFWQSWQNPKLDWLARYIPGLPRQRQ
jgi:hypothetical protein